MLEEIEKNLLKMNENTDKQISLLTELIQKMDIRLSLQKNEIGALQKQVSHLKYLIIEANLHSENEYEEINDGDFTFVFCFNRMWFGFSISE